MPSTTTLPAIHLGAPSQLGPLTLFPVWTDAPVPTKPTPLRPPKGAAISEVDGGPTVEFLKVTNATPTPFLLLEGLVVDGGWQHRVLVHDVLVAAGAEFHLNVRCVEQGRWRGETRQQLSRRRAPLAVTGALRGLHRDHVGGRVSPADRADQGEVWDRVSAYQQRVGSQSPTASMVEVFDEVGVSNEVLSSVPKPLLGQRGVLVGVDGHAAMLEIFEHPRSLAQQWDSLVESLLASTAHVPPRGTTGRRARAFVERLTRRRVPLAERAGAAVLAEDRDDLVSVRCLVDGDGRGLHAAALNVRHRLVLAA